MAQIDLFTAFAKKIIIQSDYTDDDLTYLVNQIMGLVGENNQNVVYPQNNRQDATTLELLDQLLALAAENGSLEAHKINKDILGAKLMNFIVPRPSKVRKMFWKQYHNSPRKATDYFFNLSKRSNYIKTREIRQNISYLVDTKYGALKITINLSKPEKDPKVIAAALKNKKQRKSQYPASLLAKENEGYWGRLDYAARTNHRVIPLILGQEKWYFQYSPYAYFNEHAIVLSENVRPMHVGYENLARLLEFVTLFPNYFIGSNADLPIVGGSILSHDHFQAGCYELPMAKAEVTNKISIYGYELYEAGILNWPMTTIRLIDENSENLLNAATKIMNIWNRYDDVSLSIRSHDDDGQRHHTVTPIVRFRNGKYEVDLVLRDNNVSDAYPDGIFHPHPDVQHIKQENIGLIEVMGLAILPPRLKKELAEVEKYLLGEQNNISEKHRAWADDLKTSKSINSDNVTDIVQQSVGHIFTRVLEDAGVFKKDEAGQAGLQRFTHLIEVGG